MTSIVVLNSLLLFGSGLVLIGIVSSLVASRFGAPLLLVFLAIGMLAGVDGIGGIPFSDFRATYLVGSLSLAIILFDGGLRTRVSGVRGAVAPAAVLATVGVVITAGLTGLVAMLEPFIDTIIVCVMTALVVVVSGAWNDPSIPQSAGVSLTAAAFEGSRRS